MMLFAIVVAAPVLTSIPVSTPAAMILTIAGVISFTPVIISATVVSSPQPASKPPTTAPRIKLYTGENFLMIKIIEILSPIRAANALFIIMLVICFKSLIVSSSAKVSNNIGRAKLSTKKNAEPSDSALLFIDVITVLL